MTLSCGLLPLPRCWLDPRHRPRRFLSNGRLVGTTASSIAGDVRSQIDRITFGNGTSLPLATAAGRLISTVQMEARSMPCSSRVTRS